MNAGFLSRLSAEATQSDIDIDSRFTHPDDLDVYFVRASGLLSSTINSACANSQTPISDTSLFLHVSQSFPPVPLRDEDFKDPSFLCDKSQISCLSASNDTNINVSPVTVPLAERMSQRTRSTTGASRGDDQFSRSTPSRLRLHARRTGPQRMARIRLMPLLLAPMTGTISDQK